MGRFSNSHLHKTQHIVRGITPVPASTTSIIPRISSVAPPSEVLPASQYISGKTAVGISSTAYDVAITPDISANVDLGLLYSNGYRYQYINFKAGTTGCSMQLPDRVVTVQVQTDAGPIYVDETISGYTLIDAYVGNRIAVPQLPNSNVVTIKAPIPSKLEPLKTSC